MKVLAAILMFITIGVIARAQTPAPAAAPRVVAEIAQNKSVKNSPFSADAVSESVQTLADGNRIVRNSTSKLYRNSEGRFRQEFVSGTGGFFGNAFAIGEGITVINPGQSKFYLDSNARIARVYDELASANVAIATTAPLLATRALEPVKAIEMSQLAPEARVEIERAKAELDRVKANKEQIKAAADELKVAAEQMATTVISAAPVAGVGFASTARSPKWDTRTEDLGDQNYEGVSAHGTRTITTIPAGAIGNERPIEITYERWFSNELQMVVYSKQSDPRTGEQTYRLTNINRNEPDPSLFQVPQGYKVVSDGQGMTYTVNGTGQGGNYVKSSGGQGQGATYVKGSTAQSGTRTKNQN
jgi:ABC-type transporter MlaC component